MDPDLNQVLAQYPASARPWTEPSPLGNAGGLSGSRLWRYRAGSGDLVARAWPVDGPPRATIERIHRWLRLTADLGFIPVPLASLDGRTLIEQAGGLWEVAPWLPGDSQDETRPDSVTLHAAFAALGAFHQRLARHELRGPSPGLLTRLEELTHWSIAGFSKLEGILELASDEPLATHAKEWLMQARVAAPRIMDELTRLRGLVVPLQPCLRDVRPAHFLFCGGRVTGLVDFGAMGVDTVALDLSRLIGEWSIEASADRSTALSAYEQLRPLEPAEAMLIDTLIRANALLVGGHWARWHFFESRIFRDEHAVAHGLEKGLARIRWLKGELVSGLNL